MSNARPVDQEDERVRHQHQVILTPDRVILTPDRVDIRATEVEAGLFERIHEAKKEDPTC